ncbi:GH32 C-terminal domain-containing protein [Paenibacillus sp. RS8]|uniref:GH32 C-terminal domain-containing protein n=1 Tax=unclassified Paenibacillus TaxID=185978 RepID=UPI0035C16005
MHLFLDRSSVELFANEGQAAMTSRIYPTEARSGIEFFEHNGEVTITECTYWNLKNIWKV